MEEPGHLYALQGDTRSALLFAATTPSFGVASFQHVVTDHFRRSVFARASHCEAMKNWLPTE
jgi:hypothetical protein